MVIRKIELFKFQVFNGYEMIDRSSKNNDFRKIYWCYAWIKYELKKNVFSKIFEKYLLKSKSTTE